MLFRSVAKLISVGLLISTDEWWILHDYEDHQPHAMRDQQRATKEKNWTDQKNFRDRQKLVKQMALDLQDGDREPLSQPPRKPLTKRLTKPAVSPVVSDTLTKPNLNLRERERERARGVGIGSVRDRAARVGGAGRFRARRTLPVPRGGRRVLRDAREHRRGRRNAS